MIKGIYVIRDLKTSYLNPIASDNDALAIRAFKISFERDTDLHFAPEDFQLCKIGTFDDAIGVITPMAMEVIFDGKEFVKER